MSFLPRNPFVQPHEAKVAAPTVEALGLPRAMLGNDVIKDALTGTGPAPGMFLINADRHWIEQWVFDHWEVIGRWDEGDPSEDPLADAQIGRARAAGFVGGGGGTSPAPGGSVTTPGNPFTSSCVPIFQNPDPGAIGAGMWWYDTGSNQLFIRNGTNTNWIEVCLV